MPERFLRLLPERPDWPDGVSYFVADDAFRGRPRVRVEAATARRGPGYDWFIGLRLVVGETTRLWAHVDDWWSDAEVIVTSAVDDPVLPHIRSSDVESTEDWNGWVRRALVDASVLYPGLWQLAEFPRVDRRDPRHAYAPRPPRAVLAAPWPRAFETEAFDEIVPTRTASRPDSGRVKWYRKLARDGRLPPVVLMYCAPLLGWLVLDGHDRLLAAALEGTNCRYLGLSAVRRTELPVDLGHRARVERALAEALEGKPDAKTVNGANRALIGLYEDHYFELRQRAWPLPGGASTWVRGLVELELGGAELTVREDMIASVEVL